MLKHQAYLQPLLNCDIGYILPWENAIHTSTFQYSMDTIPLN